MKTILSTLCLLSIAVFVLSKEEEVDDRIWPNDMYLHHHPSKAMEWTNQQGQKKAAAPKFAASNNNNNNNDNDNKNPDPEGLSLVPSHSTLRDRL